MRAVVRDRYGGPEVLSMGEVPIPSPADDQVLVEVVATSINLSDWEVLRGTPLYARIGGVLRPAMATLGSDIAGRVVDVGADVTAFVPGDEVYGDNLWIKGGFAEYAVVPADMLAHKPPELSFAQASAIPQSGAIAAKGTRRAGAGTRLLINGAGGGSGAFAIQLAKAAGASVTAVDNETKLEFMSGLGADDVLDHRSIDFTRTGHRYDQILDLVAHRSLRAYHRALAPGGRYRAVGGSVPSLLRILVGGAIVGPLTGRSIGVLAVDEGPKHFEPVARRAAAGEIEICIDRVAALEEVPDALARVGEGRSLGKVVVQP